MSVQKIKKKIKGLISSHGHEVFGIFDSRPRTTALPEGLLQNSP